jgi:branched-chain amino acid transport system ATP-binding protein
MTFMKVCNLRIPIGADEVLSISDLILRPGVNLLSGPNGSGKTTLMMALAGLVEIESGCVRLGELELAGIGAADRRKLGIGYVPQNSGLFERLSIAENYRLLGRVIGTQGRISRTLDDLSSSYPELSFLAAAQDRPAGSFSGGERQFAAIMLALDYRFSVLLLDEPFSLLSSRVIPVMLQRIDEYARNGTIVVISDHSVSIPLSALPTVIAMNDIATRC